MERGGTGSFQAVKLQGHSDYRAQSLHKGYAAIVPANPDKIIAILSKSVCPIVHSLLYCPEKSHCISTRGRVRIFDPSNV